MYVQTYVGIQGKVQNKNRVVSFTRLTTKGTIGQGEKNERVAAAAAAVERLEEEKEEEHQRIYGTFSL